MLESNQTEGETEAIDGKMELKQIRSTMEDLKLDVSYVKRGIDELRLSKAIETKTPIEYSLPQVNLQAESSKGKHLLHFNLT